MIHKCIPSEQYRSSFSNYSTKASAANLEYTRVTEFPHDYQVQLAVKSAPANLFVIQMQAVTRLSMWSRAVRQTQEWIYQIRSKDQVCSVRSGAETVTH